MIAIVWVSNRNSITIGQRNFMPKGSFGNLFHIGVFGCLGYCASRAFDKRGESAGLFSRTGKMAVLFTALFGLSDEVHQYFVPGRLSSVFDVILDTFGAAIALLLPWVPGGSRPRSWVPAALLLVIALVIAGLTGVWRPPGDDLLERALAALGFHGA